MTTVQSPERVGANRRTPWAIGLLMAAALLLGARPAHGQGAEPRTLAPSIFLYGFDGFLLGAGAGLGGGYLSARAGGWQGDDWRPLVYGAGFGALAGGALGLTLGITDMVNDTQGRGFFVMRDGSLGLAFGAVTGAIIGGLGAVASKDAEHVLLGGAIGGLLGTGAGVVLGVVEGQRVGRRRVALALAAAPAARGGLVWMPALVGRY
jgi:hypothetical protein